MVASYLHQRRSWLQNAPLLLAATLLLIAGWRLPTAPLRAEEPVASIDFSRDVRPILSDKCFKCHGPDEQGREADLRLDDRRQAEYVLSSDSPEDSELLRRIDSRDADEQMPPPTSKLKLSPREIATLRRWIQEGAAYQQHWSFLPPAKAPLPAVKQTTWPLNELDFFVLRRLEDAGMQPSPPASRERLIRRLSFDLSGLPPSLEEIDAFVADTDPNAYQKLVDRILQSPEYGERMAVEWLDVARYSDTYGYQVDRDRFVWPWRDWVIRAFNANMPYDQFATWQLAGDLLPQATDEQTLATTFNRLHPQKVEGGSTPEEFRVEYVADRNHTFGTAFLGLSLECCRCHDHKYDPITQREYYQLFSFFSGIDESGLYSYFTPSVPTPTLLLTNEATEEKLKDIERRIAEAEQAERDVAERGDAFQQWLAKRPSTAEIPGQVAHLDFEKETQGPNRSVPGVKGRALQLSGDDGVGVGVGNFARYQPFSVALWMNTPDVKDRAVVFHRSRAWTDAGSRGYQLLLEDGKLSASLIHFWPGNAIRITMRERLPVNVWRHVTMTYDGSSRADGLKLYVDGRPADCEVVRDNLYKNITGGGGDNITIGERFRDRGFTAGKVDEFQVFDRRLSELEVAQLHDDHSLNDALAAAAESLSDERRELLFDYYLSAADEPQRKKRESLLAVRRERSGAVDGLPEIMVMRQSPRPRENHVLKRGAYDAPGERVQPRTPAALPPFPAGQAANRLGLARWLTDPAHPLTARVTVNRYWRLCFGEGLVRTPEDFGSQGAPPTHPQLLDWLARDFVDHQWDLKRLLKTMVMSAAYRQDSTVDEQRLARDPDNKLISRGPRHRLSAEMLRDNALAVSGLLVEKIGGPPVRPYEVAASFKPMSPDKGQGLYRRSLYTFWKRTAPAPVMMALDASKRDVCVVKRERTASPLQAFVLLNDPQFVEAARVLGQKLAAKHGEDAAKLAAEAFRLTTSRHPSEPELQTLVALYHEQLEYFQQHGGRAEEFLKTGDAPADKQLPAARIAAAGVLVSALLNFEECVHKR